MKTSYGLLLALAGTFLLTACQPAGQAAGSIAANAVEQAKKGLDEANKGMAEAQKEIEAAQQKLASENLSLNRDHDGTHDLPKAEITPAGDLIVDGKTIATTPEQKQLVQAYRGQLLGVVGDGMAIGIEGAKLGMSAATGALQSLLGGKSGEDIGKQAETAARETIKPRVEKLCARLPELLKSQQALAIAVPAFQPYAGMTQSDVDDCMDNGDWNF